MIVHFLLGKLPLLRHESIPVERLLFVQTIPVFGAVIIAHQNWIGLPSSSVEVRVISRESTAFSLVLLSLQPFISLPEGRVDLIMRVLIEFLCGRPPLSLLK